MLLRRLSEHVGEQNWFAVALDFLIVVFGVFIGFQVTNWNEGRKLDVAYSEARGRLAAETQANIEAVNTFTARIDGALPAVRAAIDVLRQCSASEADTAALVKGLNQIRGTQSITLRLPALNAMTHEDGLLSRQSGAERERLSELFRALTQSQQTLDWLEQRPLEKPIEDHPLVAATELAPVSFDGLNFELRDLVLTVPPDEACRDATLVRHFYIWERTASFQHFRAEQIGRLLTENLAALD